mgnify:FL=1|tara:strand:- start:1513 stop:2163 length:651 start_codon:yes stop_codon:yes gene_type:complete
MLPVAILIPVYNEENTVLGVLNKLKRHKVYVVDDASTDKSLEILKKFKNVCIIKNKINLGYERTLLKGLRYLLKKNYEYILTLDGDGEHNFFKIKQLVSYAKTHKADLLIGNRSILNRWSETLLSKAFEIKYNIKDPISGYKLYKKKTLKKILRYVKEDKSFLVLLVYYFVILNFKIKNYNIKAVKNSVRKPRVGDGLKIDLKILKNLKFLFTNKI